MKRAIAVLAALLFGCHGVRPLPDAGVAAVTDAGTAIVGPRAVRVDAGPRIILASSQPGHVHNRDNFIDDAGIVTTVVDNSATGQTDVYLRNSGALSIVGDGGVVCTPTTGNVTCSFNGTSGVSSVTGAGTVNCSPTTGAVTCTGTNAVSSVTGTSGVSCSPTSGAVSCSNTGVTSIASGAGISVSGSTGSVTVTNTSPSIFIKSGFTDGTIIGNVNLTIGGSATAIADTLTITGVPASGIALVHYSVQITGAGAGGTEVDIVAQVDGSGVFGEPTDWHDVPVGATSPFGGRWAGEWRASGLSAGTHTFGLTGRVSSGAATAATAQFGHIMAEIVTQ